MWIKKTRQRWSSKSPSVVTRRCKKTGGAPLNPTRAVDREDKNVCLPLLLSIVCCEHCFFWFGWLWLYTFCLRSLFACIRTRVVSSAERTQYLSDNRRFFLQKKGLVRIKLSLLFRRMKKNNVGPPYTRVSLRKASNYKDGPFTPTRQLRAIMVSEVIITCSVLSYLSAYQMLFSQKISI